jgi:hypothetical protein
MLCKNPAVCAAIMLCNTPWQQSPPPNPPQFKQGFMQGKKLPILGIMVIYAYDAQVDPKTLNSQWGTLPCK